MVFFYLVCIELYCKNTKEDKFVRLKSTLCYLDFCSAYDLQLVDNTSPWGNISAVINRRQYQNHVRLHWLLYLKVWCGGSDQ